MEHDCHCHACIRQYGLTERGIPLSATRMIVCAVCGNKRCPKASDHRHECTNSNEPGATRQHLSREGLMDAHTPIPCRVDCPYCGRKAGEWCMPPMKPGHWHQSRVTAGSKEFLRKREAERRTRP